MLRAPTLRAQPRISLGLIGLVSFLLLFAAFSGAATALVSTLAAFVLAGIILGVVALLLPLPWLVVTLFITSFLITGQLMYFGGIDKAAWLPFLIGIVLLMRLPIDVMYQSQRSVPKAKNALASITAMKIAIGVFFATLAASALINAAPPYQVLVTSKEYVFLWGLYLIIAAGLIKPQLVERIWATLPWLMLIQLPIILYQRFIVLPGRTGPAAFDAVVGAFGGNPEGGGASGAMGVFCVIGIVIVLARWRANLLTGPKMFLLVLAGLIGIGLAEVKFMIILLPIAFTLLFARELARRPLRGLVFVVLGFAVSASILIAYKFQYNKVSTVQTIPEYIDRVLTGDTALYWYNPGANSMGRVASIVFWKEHHSITEPVNLMIGHGPGSTRIALTFIGEAQKRFPVKIVTTSLGVLLWETGVIGAISYVAILCFGYIALLSQSRQSGHDVESKQTLESMSVAVAMFIALVPYNTDVSGTAQIELLLLLCLGYAAARGRSSRVVVQQSSKISKRELRLRS